MCLNAFKHFLVNTSNSGENTFLLTVISPRGAKCNRLKACAIICNSAKTINNKIIQVFRGSCTKNTPSYFFTVL